MQCIKHLISAQNHIIAVQKHLLEEIFITKTFAQETRDDEIHT